MWVSKLVFDWLKIERMEFVKLREECAALARGSVRLESENIRLRADLDWFKLRLNAIEKERQQLIQAAIGVKIPIPEFTPVMEDPAKAMNQMPDFGLIGNDAPEGFDPGKELSPAPDYSELPQRANN